MNTQPNTYTKKANLETAAIIEVGATDLVLEHGGPFTIFNFYDIVKKSNSIPGITQAEVNAIGVQMDMILELMASLEKLH